MISVLFVGGKDKVIPQFDNLPVKVDYVQNGMIALNALQTSSYESIIIANKLPMLTPSRLIQELRKINPYIPIFCFISDDKRRSQILEDFESGMTFYYEPEAQNSDDLLELVLLGKQYIDFIYDIPEIDRRFFGPRGTGKIVGITEPMLDLYRLLFQIRKKTVTTILYGESGTGKNLVAESLHKNSLRRENPFVPVNCPAIPKELLESELFGHVKGSFTGADQDKIGKFQAANSGTIFLDEIGDMEQGLQAKVLRVLESSEIEKVGSNETIKVDVRIVSATNQNIEEMIEKNQFRQDLFHRINVFPMTIPSLIDHPGDIPLIAYSIVDGLKKKHSSSVNYISPGALKLMKNYHWPGNVRELENILERAILLTDDTVITSGNILPLLSNKKIKEESPKNESNISLLGSTATEDEKEEKIIYKTQPKTLKEIEKNAIVEALVYTEWNMSKAAKVLAVSRMTLYRKIEAYGIEENE
jgi:transcriptional regulator with PAS, ATPase and Fis domain